MYVWMQSDNNRSLHSVLQSMECIKKHVTLFLCITDILCGKLYPTKHPVPITVSSQLKKSVASLLPYPVCALTKSAKLCSLLPAHSCSRALCCTLAWCTYYSTVLCWSMYTMPEYKQFTFFLLLSFNLFVHLQRQNILLSILSIFYR